MGLPFWASFSVFFFCFGWRAHPFGLLARYANPSSHNPVVIDDRPELDVVVVAFPASRFVIDIVHVYWTPPLMQHGISTSTFSLSWISPIASSRENFHLLSLLLSWPHVTFSSSSSPLDHCRLAIRPLPGSFIDHHSSVQFSAGMVNVVQVCVKKTTKGRRTFEERCVMIWIEICILHAFHPAQKSPSQVFLLLWSLVCCDLYSCEEDG